MVVIVSGVSLLSMGCKSAMRPNALAASATARAETAGATKNADLVSTAAEVSGEPKNKVESESLAEVAAAALQMANSNTYSSTSYSSNSFAEQPVEQATTNVANDVIVPASAVVESQAAVPLPEPTARAVRVAEPSVRLIVNGVRPDRGPVMVAFYDSEQSFVSLSLPARTLQMQAEQATVETTVPMSGQFAVAVYQDIDRDGQLNRTRFGMPLEPFAFSNNAEGDRGPPKFDQAAVNIPAGCEAPFALTINLP